MRSKPLLILMLLACVLVHAQSFRQYGQGLDIKTFYHQQGINYYLATADENGQVYAIHYDTVTSGFSFGKEYAQVRLQIFNGISWLYSKPVKLYSLHTIDAPRALDIQYINGEVWLCGSFDSSENNMGAGLLIYDGKNWKGSGTQLLQSFPDYFEVRQILNFKDQIMVCGNFDSVPGTRVNGLLWHDGMAWKPVGNLSTYGFRNLSNTDNVFFRAIKDSLYAFNKNKIKPDSIEIGGSVCKKLAVFRNGSFVQVPSNENFIAGISSYGNDLILLPSSVLGYTSKLIHRKANTWTTYHMADSFYATNYLGSFEKGSILYVLFQNPSLAQLEVFRFDGSQIKKWKNFKIANQYLNLEFFSENGSHVICGPFAQSQLGTYTQSHKNILGLLFEAAAVVSGVTFNDLNNDQIRQISEPILQNCKVYDGQNNFFCASDADGHFTLQLPTGINTSVFAHHELNYSLSQPYVISSTMDSIYHFDIGLTAKDNNDMAVFLGANTANKAKQGFVSAYFIDVFNYSTSLKNLNIAVNYHPKLSQVNFDGFTPIAQSKGSFSIQVQMTGNSFQRFHFTGVYDTDSFGLGQKVSVTASFSAFDALTSNNADTIQQIVVAAFDPNIKVASPDVIVNTNKEITYTIWFQNLGNDTALNVTVVDTFGSLFDFRSVHAGVHSHGTFDPIVGNNVLIWNFRNIKLPPKKQDSLGSIGYVTVRSKFNQGAKEGDTIYNRAAIFFDYQKPVITNNAKVIFPRFNSVEDMNFTNGFTFFPNPTKGTVHYVNAANIHGKIDILDINGRLLFSYLLSEGAGSFELPGTLAPGIYMIRSEALNVVLGKMILTE